MLCLIDPTLAPSSRTIPPCGYSVKYARMTAAERYTSSKSKVTSKSGINYGSHDRASFLYVGVFSVVYIERARWDAYRLPADIHTDKAAR